MTCTACGGRNPIGMRFCGYCGAPLEASGSARERRRVTVLFLDLVGFSDLSHDRDPEEVRDLADRLLTRMAAEVETFDGYVDAFRGDGMVALFGAPHAHGDDPERAVRAAAVCLRAIEEVGRARGLTLRGRAGVNTGVVIAGPLGSGSIRGYTVMGSPVNLASRLERLAEPGTVLVGPETYQVARHRLRFVPVGPLSVPGFPELTRAFRFVPSDPGRQADPFGHLTFVGRRRQIEALHDHRAAVVTEGRAREVWVVGEAGSGKTRLLREAFNGGSAGASAAAGHAVVWLVPGAAGRRPWMQLASAVFDVDEAAYAPALRERIEDELASLVPNQPRLYGSILQSLDLQEARPWRRVDRRATDRVAVAWRDVLTAHARLSPGALTLVVEGDPAGTDLADLLAMIPSSQAPLLLVRTSRGSGVPKGAHVVRVPPLDPADGRALVEQLVPPQQLPAARALAPEMSGLPAHLIELGWALSLQEGRAEDEIASSLEALLQARLDRIRPPARTLLAHASLAGEHVWDELLTELADATATPLHGARRSAERAFLGGSSPDELPAAAPAAAIEALIDDKLLVPLPDSSLPGMREFRFHSDLLRRAVMRTVPLDDRPAIHVRIATWLEKRAPLSFSAWIASHFEQGGAHEAAYAHRMAAAEHAAQYDQARQASALFERLTTMPVSATLRIQAALSWAQLALRTPDADLAARALHVAAPLFATCHEPSCRRLAPVFDRLAAAAARLPGADPAAVPTVALPTSSNDAAQPGADLGRGDASADDDA